MVIARGTPDDILLILDALVRRYGWNGRLGNVIVDIMADKRRAGRILADALPATERGSWTNRTTDREGSQGWKKKHKLFQ